MHNCPRCDRDIQNPKECPYCGWKDIQKEEVKHKRTAGDGARIFDGYPTRVKCCHDDCNISAFCKIKTPTGWANLCEQHYAEYFDLSAQRRVDELGLKTVAEMRQWLRDNIKLGSFKRFPVEREPGQDWEEDAA